MILDVVGRERGSGRRSAWLTVTVDVLTGCPTALHLTIQLDYSKNGHAATTMPDGFPDLGGVPYTDATESTGQLAL